MSQHTTLLIFIFLYLILNIFIGYWASKRVHDSNDFIQAGRSLPMFFNATALFALWFGSETVFGASSEFMKHGLSGVIEDPFGGVLALLLFGFFFVRKLYRLNILTLSDLLRDKYGKTVELMSAIFMVFSFFGYIAAQLLALGIILKNVVPGMELYSAILICSVLVTFYTFIGGMWAVTITDLIHNIVIVIGLIALAIFFTNEAGGLGAVMEKYHANPGRTFEFFPEDGALNWTNWWSAWLVLGLGSLCSQDIFQRANSAKNERAAVNSTYWGAILYLIMAALPLYIGFVVKYHYYGGVVNEEVDMQQTFPQLVLSEAPLVLQILFFGSVLSAVLSVASGALLAPASIISENIVRPLSKNKLSDKKFLWILRLSVVFMAIISTITAFMGEDIYELVAMSSIVGMVSLLGPVTAALYWKKSSKVGAMLSMILGFTSWAVFEYIVKPEYYSFLPALFLSILALVAGSYLFKDKTEPVTGELIDIKIKT
ncbi:MAG TPA: sodium:solute symporter family protein [Flavobacteriales bacterium]|nr:sodium:solute symporter family protein [Flavobacteriales bacterium]